MGKHLINEENELITIPVKIKKEFKINLNLISNNFNVDRIWTYLKLKNMQKMN